MDPIIKSYSDVLEALHKDCMKQISGLTQEELDWSPGEDMNSLAILSAHIAGAERYWIGDHLMGEASGRVRDDEFSTSGLTVDALSKQLDTALKYSREAFDRLTADQLGEIRKSPQGDREFTVAWIIAHVLRHTALHLGHMEVTRQLVKSRSAT
jgi:uncharacterized damage-inducible protein DinB